MSGPAARMGDQTAHGGSIVKGEFTVLIGGKPAARVTDLQACPMMSGTVAHGSGPILPPGQFKVLINGLPAATMGDTCAPPCGASIISGDFTVLIGTEVPVVTPSVSTASANMKNSSSSQSQNDQDSKKPRFKNLKWKKDDQEIQKANALEKVKATAETQNISDGKYITLQIFEKDYQEEKDCLGLKMIPVKNEKVEYEWLVNVATAKSLKDKKEDEYITPKIIFKLSCQSLDVDTEKSSELEVKAWIKRQFEDDQNQPIKNRKYIIYLRDDSKIEGETDNEGCLEEKDMKFGIHYLVINDEEKEQ